MDILQHFEEKQSSYDELKGEWDVHSAQDLVMFLGDIHGHKGRHIDGFDGINGRHGVVGQRNFDGRMLLVLHWRRNYMSHTWPKREEKSKETFKMEE